MKVGYIALLGLPNAGKSTLVNTLVGEKVSIVTSKPQTTRQRILGVRTQGESQMIFVDAPGWIHTAHGLNSFLQQELKDVLEDADLILAVLNIDEKSPEDLEGIIEMAKMGGKPWMAVLNKSDLGFDNRIAILRGKLSDAKIPVVSGSALKYGVELAEQIIPWIEQNLPQADAFLYEKDDYTGQTVRQMAAEIVREKCFESLFQEIPYGLGVRIEKFNENESKVVKIHAEILVSKENHKAMVIGKGGETIKKIGILARQDLEKLLGRQVHLELHVSAKKDWIKDPRVMKELGYVRPE